MNVPPPGQPHQAHLRALEAAGLIRLVAAQPQLEYTFRHALLQEAVYHTLSKFARAGMHRAVAEALEAVYAGSPALSTHLGDLAVHYAQAGQWDKALDYAQRAGQHEQAMYAPREALTHFDRAVEAARRLGQPVPGPVLRARGQAHETLGQLDAALADYEQALAQARAAADQTAEWQSLLDLGFLWSARDYVQAGNCFRAALDLARTLGDPACLGHSLNRLGNWHLNNEEPHLGRQYHHEALAIFERLGDQHSVAQTLDLLGITSALMGDDAAADHYYPRAIALFEALGDRPGLISARSIYLLRTLTYETALQSTDLSLAELQQAGAEILAMARAIGLRSAETFLLGTLCLSYGPRGAYGAALAAGRAALQIAEEIQHRQWTAAAHFSLGALYLDVLHLPLAQHHLEAGLALAQQANSLIWIRIIGSALVQVYLARHRAAATGEAPAQPPEQWPPDLARAQAVLDLTRSAAGPLGTSAQALVWLSRGQLALATGDPARALELAGQLQQYADDLLVGPKRALTLVYQLRAQALTALHRPTEAITALEAARDRAREQGALGALWRVLAALGGLYAAQGQPQPAQAARAEARPLLASLARELPAGELRDNFVAQTNRYFS